MNIKKVLTVLGLGAFLVLGSVQSPTNAKPNKPCVDCAGVVCLDCPAGYHLEPSCGSCCRCVRDR
jgi:hypothetical protein